FYTLIQKRHKPRMTPINSNVGVVSVIGGCFFPCVLRFGPAVKEKILEAGAGWRNFASPDRRFAESRSGAKSELLCGAFFFAGLLVFAIFRLLAHAVRLGFSLFWILGFFFLFALLIFALFVSVTRFVFHDNVSSSPYLVATKGMSDLHMPFVAIPRYAVIRRRLRKSPRKSSTSFSARRLA